MKFSNGYWRMRDGVSPLYPMEVRDVQVAPDALTVYAPTKRIVTRGDTLNLPLLTVRASSPARASSRSRRRTSRAASADAGVLPERGGGGRRDQR